MSGSTSVLFIGKKGDPWCQAAARLIQGAFRHGLVVHGSRGEPFPEEARNWRGDYIVSYLSPWIIDARLLDRARVAAINFHPGPPEYPGIGCTNFALYNGEASFGVTCHHMAPRVDTGPLVAVKRFPIHQSDTVLSLTERCYAHILAMFHDIMDLILAGAPLPVLDQTWTRRPYRRAELDALCEIRPDMDALEVRRRCRATTYPGMPGPCVVVGGVRFDARWPEGPERS